VTPRYRHCIDSDIVGGLDAALRDFEYALANEIRHSEDFVFCVEDSHAYQEWKDYLTYDEMREALWRASR
jgi:hypothetical protein